MKTVLSFVLLFVLAILLFASPFLAFATSSTGYVEYTVSVTGQNTTHSFTVKESVSPSTSPSLSSLVLSIGSSMQNLTFSKLVNSSSPLLFPYMIPLNNESLSYDYGNYSLSLHASNTGTSNVFFNGTNYQLTEYAFTAGVSNLQMSEKTISGELSTFPSNLVYSATIMFNGSSVSAKLLSTSLALDPPASGALSQSEAIAVSGVAAAVVAILAFVGIRKWASRPKQSFSESKPSYWVD